MTTKPPEAAAMTAWGDFALTFEAQPPASARQSGGWIEEARGGRGTLWRQDAGTAWHGFPVERIAAPGTTLWLLGELYGGDASPADTLLAVAGGDRSPSDLNGHFALLGWNATERQWHAWTDRFGTVHVYFAADGARACLGTFFPSVAAAASRRKLAWEGIAGFFAFGFFPEDRTFFEDVRILRPASHYVFGETGELASVKRYWRWRHVPEKDRSYDDTVAEFARTLHEVLDDPVPGRLAVPISGGLDSRTTVAALTRSDRGRDAALWSYSYGYGPDSEETRIAGRVAAERSLPFRALTVGPYLFDELPRVLSCVEGFQDATQARQIVVADLLAAGADRVLAAHWGDVWLNDMGLTASPRASEEVVAHATAKIAKKGRDWLLEHVAAPRLKEPATPVLDRMLARELALLDDIEDPDFRVKAFKTDQWSFRWTLASLRMYQAGAFPRLPFYDIRLANFFATVPTAFVEGRRLQIDYLKRFAPDLARIRWQAYGTNLYWQRHFDTWLLPWRAARKLARGFRRNGSAAERNWEIQFSGRGAERLRSALLARGCRLHEFVPPSAIENLLDNFSAAPLEQGRGYTVSMLLTFSAWLEAYG
jgi:hypothetical protein